MVNNSKDFQSRLQSFTKANGGFFPAPTYLYSLHENEILNDKELIVMLRILGECNAKNNTKIRIAHSKIMRYASCRERKANDILKSLVHTLKFLICEHQDKRSGYSYSVDFDALEGALRLYSDYCPKRSSETVPRTEDFFQKDRATLSYGQGQHCPRDRENYIYNIILNYYSYIRFLNPFSKTRVILDFVRLEGEGFDRKAIKFFLETNQINFDQVRSVYALIKSYGKNYFSDVLKIEELVKKEQKSANSDKFDDAKKKIEEKEENLPLEELEELKKKISEFIGD